MPKTAAFTVVDIGDSHAQVFSHLSCIPLLQHIELKCLPGESVHPFFQQLYRFPEKSLLPTFSPLFFETIRSSQLLKFSIGRRNQVTLFFCPTPQEIQTPASNDATQIGVKTPTLRLVDKFTGLAEEFTHHFLNQIITIILRQPHRPADSRNEIAVFVKKLPPGYFIALSDSLQKSFAGGRILQSRTFQMKFFIN